MKPGIPPGPWYVRDRSEHEVGNGCYTISLSPEFYGGHRDGYYLNLSGCMSLETARLLAMVPEMHAFVIQAAETDPDAQRILTMIREGRP